MKLEKSKSLFTYYSLPIGFFLLIFLTTIYAYHQTKKRGLLLKRQAFEFRTQLAKSAIERRFLQNTQLLRGAKGFFESTQTVTRQEWYRYIKTLQLDKMYPGIQGTGFAQMVKSGEVKAHIEAIRSEGFPDYTITPAGERPIYIPIIFLEPFEGRNLSAFGFDMYSDSIRREAMDKAWVTGEPALSGKLTLVQEITEVKQPGFLLYLPVYNTKTESLTVSERLSNLVGFVYNPFRAYDLMSGIFQDHYPDLDIEIYDGVIKKENLLYDKEHSVSCLTTKDLQTSSEVYLAQRKWTICFAATPGFGASPDDDLPKVILAGGTIIG
ncbi:MAG TPA: CHASE domain-containing protein, partial [Cytophagaceae bacterium]